MTAADGFMVGVGGYNGPPKGKIGLNIRISKWCLFCGFGIKALVDCSSKREMTFPLALLCLKVSFKNYVFFMLNTL